MLFQILRFFTVDNLRFARKSSEILTLANCLTVLQTYRQAFLIPQLTCITGIFALNLNTGIFALKLWSCELESDKSRIQVVNLRAKIPVSNQLTLKVIGLGWVRTQDCWKKNTSSCLNQLSYWNRQETRQFFRALSGEWEWSRQAKVIAASESDRGERKWSRQARVINTCVRVRVCVRANCKLSTVKSHIALYG